VEPRLYKLHAKWSAVRGQELSKQYQQLWSPKCCQLHGGKASRVSCLCKHKKNLYRHWTTTFYQHGWAWLKESRQSMAQSTYPDYRHALNDSHTMWRYGLETLPDTDKSI